MQWLNWPSLNIHISLKVILVIWFRNFTFTTSANVLFTDNYINFNICLFVFFFFFFNKIKPHCHCDSFNPWETSRSQLDCGDLELFQAMFSRFFWLLWHWWRSSTGPRWIEYQELKLGQYLPFAPGFWAYAYSVCRERER